MDMMLARVWMWIPLSMWQEAERLPFVLALEMHWESPAWVRAKVDEVC